MVWPRSHNGHGLVHALAAARYEGMPELLETWLLCVALMDASRWTTVKEVLMRLDYFEPWAIEEAGYLIVGGNAETQRERAKVWQVRAETYAATVGPVVDVLVRWLDRAARLLADQLIEIRR